MIERTKAINTDQIQQELDALDFVVQHTTHTKVRGSNHQRIVVNETSLTASQIATVTAILDNHDPTIKTSKQQEVEQDRTEKTNFLTGINKMITDNQADLDTFDLASPLERNQMMKRNLRMTNHLLKMMRLLVKSE